MPTLQIRKQRLPVSNVPKIAQLGMRELEWNSNLFDFYLTIVFLLSMPLTASATLPYSEKEDPRPRRPLFGLCCGHPEPSCHGDHGSPEAGLGINEEISKVIELGWQDAGMAGREVET